MTTAKKRNRMGRIVLFAGVVLVALGVAAVPLAVQAAATNPPPVFLTYTSMAADFAFMDGPSESGTGCDGSGTCYSYEVTTTSWYFHEWGNGYDVVVQGSTAGDYVQEGSTDLTWSVK